MRYLTNAKREARREKNGDAVRAIYDRAAQLVPADYMVCHQQDGPEYAEGARGNPPKLFSTVARHYASTSPKIGAGRLRGRFTDIRSVPYEVQASGAIVRVRKDENP